MDENGLAEPQELGTKEHPKANFSNLFKVLITPSGVMNQIVDQRYAWVYPFLAQTFFIVLGILLGSQDWQEQLNSSRLSGLSQILGPDVAVNAIIVFSILSAPIMVLLSYLIPSLVFMFFGNFILEGTARLRQIINVTAYATVPGIIKLILTVVIPIGGDSPGISFSPAVILPSEIQQTFLGVWLGIFDLFSIWQLSLAIIGLSILYHHSKIKTATWLIPLYLVVSTFFALISSWATELATT